MIEADRIIHITDLPAIFCHKGCREFFSRNQLNYVDFLQKGIPLSELRKIDDDRVRMLEEHLEAQATQSAGVE